MRRLLRLFLDTLKWTSMTLSTLLFVVTMILWIRSTGHLERWTIERFEQRQDWTRGPLKGKGRYRAWPIIVLDGRIWIAAADVEPSSQSDVACQYQRVTLPAEHAQQTRELFESTFKQGERAYMGGFERAWHFAGLGFRHRHAAISQATGRPAEEHFTLAIPFWMLTALFVLWPLLFVAMRLRQRNRFAKGLCPSCGYDLRATPDRCPECGRAVEIKPEP